MSLWLWTALAQVRLIIRNADEALFFQARFVLNEGQANTVRLDSDFSATPFKAKISKAEQLRVHTMPVIHGRDLEARRQRRKSSQVFGRASKSGGREIRS